MLDLELAPFCKKDYNIHFLFRLKGMRNETVFRFPLVSLYKRVYCNHVLLFCFFIEINVTSLLVYSVQSPLSFLTIFFLPLMPSEKDQQQNFVKVALLIKGTGSKVQLKNKKKLCNRKMLISLLSYWGYAWFQILT